jgi:hypothetical protein
MVVSSSLEKPAYAGFFIGFSSVSLVTGSHMIRFYGDDAARWVKPVNRPHTVIS